MFADDVKLWRPIRSDADRQLRGDLIQTYRIARGLECALNFDEVFELAETDRLRGHPFKLQRKLAHSDVRRNAFSHRRYASTLAEQLTSDQSKKNEKSTEQTKIGIPLQETDLEKFSAKQLNQLLELADEFYRSEKSRNS
nr:unnamed protein product [Spirometra erinaceieuropaei]